MSNYNVLAKNLFSMEIHSLFEICHFGELEPHEVLGFLFFGFVFFFVFCLVLHILQLLFFPGY